MVKKYIEPYAKENNILQLSLFYFGRGRMNETVVEWKDTHGENRLRCVCRYGVPGSFDQDVYTACMRIWVKQGMVNDGVKVSYTEIARELGLNPRNWTSKIKKSLQKLAMARFEFTQSFLKAREDGVDRVDTYFSLFESATLFDGKSGKAKKKASSTLNFPREIRENLELKYYQMLDMVWYRALPEGLPRRLYEYLEKRRYHSKKGVFTISEEALCRWLPVKTKNTTKRRQTLEKIVNHLIEAGYLEAYEFDKKRKMCLFTYAASGPPEEAREERPVQSLMFKEVETHSGPTHDIGAYEFALEWVNSIPYFRKKNLKAIKDLPRDRVEQIFPHVKRMWEEGRITKPGGVYAAFMEGWMDEGVVREQEEAARREKEKRAKEAQEGLHRAEVAAFVHQHGLENVFFQGGPLVAITDDSIRCMNGAGGTRSVAIREVNIELDFTTRQQLEKLREEEEKARAEKKAKKAKKAKVSKAKRDEHKKSIQRFLKRQGLERVNYSGCQVLDFDEEGITIDREGKEVVVKYGNVIEGGNLKVSC